MKTNVQSRVMLKRICTIYLCLAMCAIGNSRADNELKIPRCLKLAVPEVKWGKIIQADLDADGIIDVTVLGVADKMIVLGFVLGSHLDTPLAFRLSQESGAAGGVCGEPADALIRLEKRLVDPDSPSSWAVPLEVTKSKRASPDAIRVEVGDCDAFHFYFDYTKKAMTWWRR